MRNIDFDRQIKESNLAIIVHEHVTGAMAHILRDYLLERKPKNLLFIAHPLLYIKETYKKSSYFEWYVNGELKIRHSAYHWKLPEQFLYIKDFIYTIIWSLKIRKKIDLIVAVDPLNTIASLPLKYLGIAKKVAFYCIDYFPTRFQNPIMNKIYHQIDKLSVRFSDETWNLGKRMAIARAETNNMKGPEYKKRQFHMPIGVWFSRIKRANSFNHKKLIYAGGFIDYMGIDLAIRALPLILKKVPNVKIELIGSGQEKENWIKIAKQLGVERNLIFLGWMENREAFHLRLSKAAIGLAPFNYHILDDKVKNADPGKIKDYTSSGLPVITTKAIYTWKDIAKFKCGIVIDYDEKEFAKAVVLLLSNKQKLMQYRKGALNYASQFDWDIIFRKNLGRILR